MESESNPYTTSNIIPFVGTSSDSEIQNNNISDDNMSTSSLSPSKNYNNNNDLVQHNNTLESTNKLLHDIEQKLTPFSPTASVSSSQYTQTDSVVHNTNLDGLGKSTISSSVLQYIINNNEEDEEDEESATRRIHNNIFDPNELFNERNNKFMTKFGKGYNDDNLIHQQRKLIRKNSLMVNQDRLEKKISDSSLNGHSSDINSDKSIEEIDSLEKQDNDSIIESKHVQEQLEELRSCTNTGELNEKVDNDNDNDEDEDEDEDESAIEPNIDDLYLPPSPPRSPPREIDPNKLYGLYDFSGPDPSHCTLQRDEPVHLVNDEDNYWWLIRKLTKQERIERGLDEGQDHEILTDEEDGKVGFVPAECLETYGERLARLNCFKNEELEKKEVTEEDEGNSVDSISSRSNKKCNKSVTFESLGEIEDDEDDNEEEEQEQEQEQQHEHEHDQESRRPPGFGYFIHDEITKDEQKSDDKQSEILSDVFPETPLNIPKHKRLDKKPEKLNTTDVFSELFIPPKRTSLNTLDDISIGSFSPDTPPKREEPEEDDNSSFTRSIILDRLSKVTSDIQEQIQQTDSDPEQQDQIYSENPYHRTARKFSTSTEFQQLETDNIEIETDVRLEQQPSPTPEHSSSHLSLHKSKKESIDEATTSSFEDLITPSTSVNSLNETKNERRKSKPVHEMFIPILGKFDELAEKLAELDDILSKS